MILLWGVPADRPLALVRDALAAVDAPVLFIDQRDVAATEACVEVDGMVRGWVRSGGTSIAVEAIAGIYVRPYDPADFPDVAADPSLLRRAAALTDVLLALADTVDAVVVNRPTAMQSNGSKPYQAVLIRRFGFDIPDTLVTTDPEAVRAFRVRHPELVYKSVSSSRSIVRRFGDADETRLRSVTCCPTQFQRRVSGIDYRVHVVGEDVFPVRVHADADDYRYADAWIEPCRLPADVEARCARLATGLGLLLAGIDLRHTPDGRWVCFEVNTSPAYSCFETRNRDISAAIARLLRGGRPRGSAVR